ncbi:MAG: glycosyltransferase family 2 protein, partial [Planctomycetales bacterium]|nr:glycosyltransferase family 2 protein [Planctomycetales bacterium]
MPAPDVSVVIVSWNTRDLLAACLRSVAEAGREVPHETIVVDNGSEDGSGDLVAREFPAVRLVRNGENRGYAAAANQGIREGSGRYVLLLNPDATLPPDALRALVAYADREPRVGLVGAALRDPDGRVQKSVAAIPSLATELLNRDLLRLLLPSRFPDLTDGTEPSDVPSVVGACLLARREAIEKVGPLDEGYFVFLEETDWCVRMREAGWRVVHHPGVRVVHAQGRAKERDPVAGWIEYYRSLYRFFRRR